MGAGHETMKQSQSSIWNSLLGGGAALCLTALVGMPAATFAQETPVRGGDLTIGLTPSEPANFDCAAGITSSGLTVFGPVYSLLLKYNLEKFPAVVGDVADSWQISPDGLTYTFKLHPNIHFHDGSAFGAEDVKATYDRLRDPPTGVVSIRRGMFDDIASIDVVDPLTVVFHLTKPNPGMLTVFANPWNCLYSAAKLKEDPTYPKSHLMGTGPFMLVDRVAGSSWNYKRFDGYFRAGHPYLDSIKVITLAPPAVLPALSGGQVGALLYTVSDSAREQIAKARGDKTAFQNTGTTTESFLTFNTAKKPFDDVRVRRALTLAIDRRGGEENIRKITTIDGFGGIIRPGTPYAASAADKEKLLGHGRDMAAARAEAKRLLAEAGVPNLKFTLITPNVRDPWEAIGIFVIDQWRQIGLTVDQNTADLPTYIGALSGRQFDVIGDFNAPASDDPTEILTKFLPGNPVNYSGVADPVLADLFNQQKHELDPAKRKQLVDQFQTRQINEAYMAPLFWATRTAVLPANARGWTVTPSFVVGNDVGDFWLKP